jgi:hypothetical protein
MGRILLGVLLGAFAATILTVALIQLIPFVVLLGLTWFVVWTAIRSKRRTRWDLQGHAEPMQRSANPHQSKALPPPKMANSFRRSGAWSRNWK